jgi:hypothetical protein
MSASNFGCGCGCGGGVGVVSSNISLYLILYLIFYIATGHQIIKIAPCSAHIHIVSSTFLGKIFFI